MRNIDEEQTHAFTYAEAPRILFPFARRVIADAVRDAGFPPLMLDPLDFNGLYMQQLRPAAGRRRRSARRQRLSPLPCTCEATGDEPDQAMSAPSAG